MQAVRIRNAALLFCRYGNVRFLESEDDRNYHRSEEL